MDATDDFVPLGAGSNFKTKTQSRLSEVKTSDSLVKRCIVVVVANLEQFPAEAMGILSEDDWDSVVRMRHKRTAPTKGKGGLDGKGRLHPAISERFLEAMEEANPHLSKSAVTDSLVWRDCVEYKFRRGGPSRPAALTYPWPVLLDRIGTASQDVKGLIGVPIDEVGAKERQIATRSAEILRETSVNLAVLEATGAGKMLKKFVKHCSKYSEFAAALQDTQATGVRPVQSLQKTLEKWMALAGQSPVGRDGKHPSQLRKDEVKAFNVAQSCHSWRDLFHSLNAKEKERMEQHGARMRERRQKLAKTQPKIVRVAPRKSRQEAILNFAADRRRGKLPPGMGMMSLGGNNDKMRKLRGEAAAVATRQRTTGGPTTSATFANAVAFSSAGRSAAKRKTGGPTTTIELGGGKRMKIPQTKHGKMGGHR